MKEFLLIFRGAGDPAERLSPTQMQAVMTDWMNWMGGIAAQNKLADKGNRLGSPGAKVIRPNNVITDGPYTELKEIVSGYIIIKADTVDEATELASGCPILKVGGSVEVRTVIEMATGN